MEQVLQWSLLTAPRVAHTPHLSPVEPALYNWDACYNVESRVAPDCQRSQDQSTAEGSTVSDGMGVEWEEARSKLCAVNLALVHGLHSGLGLADWVDGLFQPDTWTGLPQYLRAHLLLQLSSVLRILPSSSQARVASAIASGALLRCVSSPLDAESGDTKEAEGGAESGRMDELLLAAVCIGLAWVAESAFVVETGSDGVRQDALQLLVQRMVCDVLLMTSVPSDWAPGSAARLVVPQDVELRLVAGCIATFACGPKGESDGDCAPMRRACLLHRNAGDEESFESEPALTSGQVQSSHSTCVTCKVRFTLRKS